VTTKLVVGTSTARDEREAAAEAVAGALRGAERATFALVLCTNQYRPAALAEAVSAALGDTPWVGCCAPGVFAGSRLMRQGLVVGVMSSPLARVGIGIAPGVAEDGRTAGVKAAERALDGFPMPIPAGWSRALMVLSDGQRGTIADVVRGAMQVAGTGVVWAGGGGSGGPNGEPAPQFAHGRAHTDSVVVVAIDSPARMAAGISHGFRPYGPPTMVTRAQGSVAAELEYEVAFPVYQRTARARGDDVTLESFPDFSVTHPLGIPRADGEHVIRDPLSVDASGGLACSGEVPDGGLVRVMEGDRAGLLGAAREATSGACAGVAGPVAGAFVFDCVSRNSMLGEGFLDELEIFRSGVGRDTPLMGCLTLGEIGALGRGIPQFHNKTAVVLALGS
jgi:hypothetical protein